VREAWDADAIPNLLLIDRLRSELRAGAPDLDALADLERIIEPLIAAADLPRALLEKLVQRGAAPSPFCVIP
jgi:hypothetical protein